MQIFEQTLARFHNHLLRKKLPSLKTVRSSMYLGNASTIGIMFDGTHAWGKASVLRYANQLKSEGKHVKLLAYFNHKQPVERVDYQWFNRKDLNWKLQPVSQDALAFAQEQFDLLMNLSPAEVLPLDYIAALSKARFRVGPCIEKTYCYDLMIDTKRKNDPDVFIEQVDYYLKKLRPASTLQIAKTKKVLEGV